MNNSARRQKKPDPKPLFSEGSERAIIGMCIHDSATFWNCVGKLRPEHFYVARLGRIWKAMNRCGETGSPISTRYIPLMIENDHGEDTPIKMLLAALLNDAPPASEAEIEVDTIVNFANKRALLESLELARHEIMDADSAVPSEHLKDIGIKKISAAFNGDRDDDMMEYHEWGTKVWHRSIDTLAKGETAHVGLDPGLSAVTDAIGRFLPGKLYVLAGMSSSGKSALARQLLESACADAMSQGLGWGYIASLEMTGEEYATRSLAQQLGIPADRIEQGGLNQNEVERIGTALSHLRKMPIIIDQRPRQNMENIRARALKVKNTKGLSMIAADHLLLIKGGPKDSLMDRVADATIESKNLAKELGVPMLLLAQMDEKKIMETTTQWPNSTHLFGGQSIMQNSDVILIVHRPEIVVAKREPGENAKGKNNEEKSPHAKWQDEMERVRGRAWVYNNKRRGGAGNKRIEMVFDGPTMVFKDI